VRSACSGKRFSHSAIWVARALEHPPADVNDQTAVLGEREEVVRREQPRRGWSQRISASKPVMRPSARLMIG
jgi:hypothetical protein